MPKQHKRTRRRSRRHRRSLRGGDASSYALTTFGDGNAQFNNVMNSTSNGTALFPLHGSSNNLVNAPSAENLSLIQNAVKRRKGSHSRKHKKGGSYGHVLSRAAVPLSILGLSYLNSRRRKQRK